MKQKSTEQRNPASMNLDTMSSIEIVTLMNEEDRKTVEAVKSELPLIAAAAEAAADAFRRGGRLFYMGAGTSGRLGILDASECPPTFGVPEGRVVALIAGGKRAVLKAVENAEDSAMDGENDLRAHNLFEKDVVCGIAASGSTPYVLGGLSYAKSIGCKTVSIACVKNSLIGEVADVKIEAVPGPEVLTGSTRLKSGTVTKMILNMISTASMALTGRCYENLMVNVQATNEKLRDRAVRITAEAAGTDEETAGKALLKAGGSAKTAIVMLLFDIEKEEAERLLNEAGGKIRLIGR